MHARAGFKHALAVTVFLLCIFFTAKNISAYKTVIHYGRFGTVTLYKQSASPSRVVLFVSGDGGWNLGVIDMARELASLDALVAGIDITHYMKEMAGSSEKCSYPAADFEMLSKYVQKKLEFPRYVPPVLIVYSSGATLVYAILVQSPPNTFQGAVSLGFCPDLSLIKPLCKGNGLEWEKGPRGKGFSFLPAKNLRSPWIAFQGEIDQVCFAKDTEEYVRQVNTGQIVRLLKVGHGFSVPQNWMPQFRKAFTGIVSKREVLQGSKDEEVKDLPLVEVRSKKDSSHVIAVIISGDGGWASLDRELGEYLADKGISVVGFNSLQYFWTRRTPESAAHDMERVLKYYLAAWNKDEAVIIGYSLGADVLPFIVNRLSRETLNHIQIVVLLGPGHEVDFEFHITDWLGGSSGKTSFPVLSEVEELRGRELKVLCFYGEEEKNPLCKILKDDFAKVFTLKGGHHFSGDYGAIAETVLHEMSR